MEDKDRCPSCGTSDTRDTNPADYWYCVANSQRIRAEAAEAEVARLREALTAISKLSKDAGYNRYVDDYGDIARKALKHG